MREALKVIAIVLVLVGGLGVGMWQGAEWYARKDVSFSVVWLDLRGKQKEASTVCYREAEKHAEAGRNAEAINWLDRSLAYAREVGPPLWTAGYAEQVSAMYSRLGDNIQRAILLSEARDMYLGEKNFMSAALMAFNLGDHSLKKEVLNDAEKWYLQAIADVKAGGGEASPNPLYYRRLGEVYLKTERPSEAMESLEQAVQLAREGNNQPELDRAAESLARARQMYQSQSGQRAREAELKRAAETLEVAPN